jgi:outer membrane protein
LTVVRVSALILIAAMSLPGAAVAMSLPEAIVLAERTNPDLVQARARAEAADARLDQARAGRLPSLILSGESGQGTSDLGGFFGFAKSDVAPRAASVELRQPLFSGGAINAAVARAQSGSTAARALAGGARADLAAQVAEVYVGVQGARQRLALNLAQVRQIDQIARDAALRFQGGEIARTDVAQAQARLAEAQAGLARARGELALGQARFQSVVGAAPDGLEPAVPPPSAPSSLDDATARAEATNPGLLAAQANARAAEAKVRFARAERLPSLALSAKASSVHDQFLPGYRADDVTVGVQGQWTLFAGGAINGRVNEALADLRAARAGLDAARAGVKEAVIGGWSAVETARAVASAAQAQAEAAASALDSVRQEVRVGQKPTLALLDAEREALAADSALVAAQGGVVVAEYRLAALATTD